MNTTTRSCIYTLLFLSTTTIAFSPIVPEIEPSRITTVSNLISTAFGDSSNPTAVVDRYAQARRESAFNNNNEDIPLHELVYGELSVQVLANLLDAVGVYNGDIFLDIGSGDGALVLGASLLYATNGGDGGGSNAIQKAVGLEIVPGLVDRSKVHLRKLQKMLQDSSRDDVTMKCLCDLQSVVQFVLGDVHDVKSQQTLDILSETTLAVCFATTWSAGNARDGSTSLDRRRLPKLSAALSHVGKGARIIVIDGRLDEDDGFDWQGDLRVDCPDTAPYSTASLYVRR